MVAGEGEFLTDRIYLVPSDESYSVQADEWREDAFSIWSHDESEDFTLNSAFKGIRKKEVQKHLYTWLSMAPGI